MKLEAPKNANYAAVVVRVNTVVDLPGLDNLVGIPVLGHQALTQRGKSKGDLVIAFTAETQLSDEYAAFNSLYRDSELNADKTEKGYLENNRRIRAIKLRGHVSNALLMPLSSVEYAIGTKWLELQEGDTFDALGDHLICKKYEVPRKQGNVAKTKTEKAFKRVTTKVFPEHLETDQYHRSKHLLDEGREVVVTQKLHGTSLRVGHVPVERQLSLRERIARRLGVRVDTYEWDVVFGSRKVIKDANNPRQQHFYKSDIWSDYGKQIAELIPEGYIVYGELIGFTPDGAAIQKNYTYHLNPGETELYAYRVAHVNKQGHLSDLSWDGVKAFCRARGLKWVPELTRVGVEHLDELVDLLMDERFAGMGEILFTDPPLIVSSHKTVDEGVCIRQEGIVPVILKAKAPKFLEHETKMLDKEELDLESLAA